MLAEADASSRRWVRRQAGKLRDLLAEALEPRRLRRRLDESWERLRLDPPPGEEIGRSWRALLASVEDLVRRQSARRKNGAGPRLQQIGALLGCLEPQAEEGGSP
ncbi:MAG: hypothetical protein Q9Q13_00245 [Acidobacteriota bacterium]|nr:hypothetical protein [Acidobacteriota bacterium]